MGRFAYWQSVRDRQWYWRLIDERNTIRGTGHQGFSSEALAWWDMDWAEYTIADRFRALDRHQIADPNVRSQTA